MTSNDKLCIGLSTVTVSESVAGLPQDQLTQGTVGYFENATPDGLENTDQPTEKIQKLKITPEQIKSRCSKPVLANGKSMDFKGAVYLM